MLSVAENDAQLEAAYAACRTIAKTEAKNFYYAFVALPAPRRNAICAVYAFMRQADDLADDETLAREERKRLLEEWLAAWHRAAQGEATTDPTFVAVRDAVQRFGIGLSLLDQLVEGVSLDLTAAAADAPATFPTFPDLYRYCYLVASVVGIICIRIFGYTDPAAETLAEETGIAFQLTNILRDVAEDAGRRRVYLPLDELAAHGVTADSLVHRPPGAPPTAAERAVLAAVAQRAERYYGSAWRLLPLVDPECRPALWILVTIYHRLLGRIRRANYDVFSHRASVPRTQKLAILLIGQARMAMARRSGPKA